jgi:hypothetical protein
MIPGTILCVHARTGFIVFRSKTSQERSSNKQRVGEVTSLLDRLSSRTFNNF